MTLVSSLVRRRFRLPPVTVAATESVAVAESPKAEVATDEPLSIKQDMPEVVRFGGAGDAAFFTNERDSIGQLHYPAQGTITIRGGTILVGDRGEIQVAGKKLACGMKGWVFAEDAPLQFGIVVEDGACGVPGEPTRNLFRVTGVSLQPKVG